MTIYHNRRLFVPGHALANLDRTGDDFVAASEMIGPVLTPHR